MKKLHLIGIVCFLLFSFQTSLSQEKINQLNAKGKRTGVWKKNYNNGKIRYVGQFKNGKEIGVFKFYSALSSEHPVAIKTFENNSNLAKVSFYTVKGVLQSEGLMDGKKRIGLWKYFQEDGKKLLSEENYKNGVLEGKSVTYYKSGKVAEMVFYKNDKLDGNTKRYAESGILLDDLNYKEGKLNGLAKYYNIEGKLIYTGDYENDVKVGKWQYFENGKSVSVDKFKE
ncbi:MAG: toxin-antitoxin system YwqK family antitoxin [Lutibacter sp.]|uniref:toxin-antitoxin system YwqK family antitoxin n=1 Tax=Lutibacter sp. TaxID=1925666 RepID=UPI00299F080E|nr:toxin-antitoxin system YwqK family antitoxin [Lutibacter sp.]MDX1830222.1 toxin-antitoxin system YwqK family antitoxin [Lutibacter sp.]